MVGIGLGFRTDLDDRGAARSCSTVAFLVPSAVTPVRRGGDRRISRRRSPSPRFPLLGRLDDGNNIGPVALLGLTAPIRPAARDRAVDLRVRQPVQRFARLLDRQQLRHSRRGPASGVDLSTSASTTGGSRRTSTQLASMFPADLVTRIVCGQSATIPRYFLDSSLFAPIQVQSAFVRALYRSEAGFVAACAARFRRGRARHAR